MTLTVLHYHFRPGGVRQVIETGLPALASALGADCVILAGGEMPEEKWRLNLEESLHPRTVAWRTDPALGYWSEQVHRSPAAADDLRERLIAWTTPGGVVWAHNLSVGRNMQLARAVAALPANREVWLHHHDWWWDGRWERWPEMEAQGLGTLEEAIGISIPSRAGCRHFCINREDAGRLRAWAGMEACFLPNPAAPQAATGGDAHAFLKQITGAGRNWVYPCRGLRRKNIAEALLVQRCMDPGAATVITGGPSSAAEAGYYASLERAALQHGWPLFMGVCLRPEAPPVPDIVAAAAAIPMTSLREGFGLPYHEAANFGRPLLARIPEGLLSTLHATGLVLESCWETLEIPRHQFDGKSEMARRDAGLARVEGLLPEVLRPLPFQGSALSGPTIDFGSLSLTAQLEVLSQPEAVLRESVPALNPALARPLIPQRPGRLWPAELWAKTMLESSRAAAPRPSFADEAPRYLLPLLERWLKHPLLWEP